MSSEVSHKGRVISVSDDTVRVEIISQSACSSCHAAGLCSMSEAVRKEIEVPVSSGEKFNAGDSVEVILGSGMGMKAVVLAYAAPLVVMLAVCMALTLAGVPELYAGLASLAGIAVYYSALFLARKRLAGRYVFRIVKENNLNS